MPLSDIFRAKETRAALAALDELRGMFNNSLVFDDLRHVLRAYIVNSAAAIREQIARGRSPHDICLLALVKLSGEEIAGGKHHVYRGVLALTGQERLALWNKGMDDLVARGVLSEEVRAERRCELHRLIESAG